jgi:hypothetical protein
MKNSEAPAGEFHLADPVLVTVDAGPTAGPVLSRATAAMAARAELPLDRINDAGLIAESLAAHSGPYSADGRVHLRLGTKPGHLVMRVGPLTAGGARSVLADATLPGLGPVIERLADGVTVLTEDHEDHLEIVVKRA